MSLQESSPAGSTTTQPRSWWGPAGGWKRITGALSAVALLTAIAFGLLFAVVIPGHHEVNGQIFGIGLAITAYLLGVRHAFDADHIAAIDNTTRKFVADGKRPVTTGLFFSLGHSTVVFVMAILVAIGANFVATLVNDDTTTHQTLGIIGTSVSGVFLIIIGLINLAALLSIYRVWREARTGGYDEAALEGALNNRGLFARLLRPAMKAIKRPGQLYPLGILFGLGFDTATEISLLVLAGAGAATGLPWYAVLVLPLLFAAGMSLFDTLDGAFMQAAYQWAFIKPVRKVYYNLTTTGLSVAVALLIGGIEIITVLHDKAELTDPVTSWIAAITLDDIGYVIVALFLFVWVGSVLYWRLSNIEDRWTAQLAETTTAVGEQARST
jgi:high-affinity nickel-transport protein